MTKTSKNTETQPTEKIVNAYFCNKKKTVVFLIYFYFFLFIFYFKLHIWQNCFWSICKCNSTHKQAYKDRHGSTDNVI